MSHTPPRPLDPRKGHKRNRRRSPWLCCSGALLWIGAGVLWAGCEAPSKDACGGCAAGAVCNPQTMRCEAPPGCQASEVGSCGLQDVFCQAGSCESCPAGTKNCDGINGCECQGLCGGSQCTTVTGCQPTTPNACGQSGSFCQNGTCQSCPVGMSNCDGLNGCECAGACNGTQCQVSPGCSPGAAHVCGNSSAYCQNGSCLSCPANRKNCDGLNDCECAGVCSGQRCSSGRPCQTNVENSCQFSAIFCQNQICTPCPAGRFNCDGINDCECTTGCSGKRCSGGAGNCDPRQANACLHQLSFCDNNTCRLCDTGTLNCDGTGGCECTGTCVGYICDTANSCKEEIVDSCGSNTRRCLQTRCMPCNWGLFNCDGVFGCECQGGCNGSSCGGSAGCSATLQNSCGSTTSYCQGGICTACPQGSVNCDGVQNCECFGRCVGLLCSN